MGLHQAACSIPACTSCSAGPWGAPSTHGVLRVIVKLDGEKVLGTDCVMGYLHRGVEKIGENRTYHNFIVYTDRHRSRLQTERQLGKDHRKSSYPITPRPFLVTPDGIAPARR